MKNKNTLIPRFPAALMTVIVSALASPLAVALPFEVNKDIRGLWNNRIVVGAAWRVKDPDKQLVGSGNGPEYPGSKGAVGVADDGNLNYRKGNLVSAPIVYTTSLELRYKNQYGAYAKARTWWDYANETQHAPHGSILNGFQPDKKLEDGDYYDYNRFSGFQLLDAYVYGNWDIGESRLTARLGRKNINWGESLLHIGINAFNPINFAALGRPGVRLDDAQIPVNRIYGNFITKNSFSIEAFYALDWEASRLPACGTFGQGIDSIADPGCAYATAAAPFTDQQQYSLLPPSENPFLTPRGYQSKPSNWGQWGVSTRYFAESLDTEFGLYYVNYHATNPVLDLTLCDNGWDGCTSQDGIALGLKYHEDIKGMAISASTGLRSLALSAELSHFRDLPVQRNFPEMIEGAIGNRGIYAERMVEAGGGALFSGGWKADQTQLLLGGELDLSRTIGLGNPLLAIEAAGLWATNLPGTDEERIGRNPNWGAATPPGGVCQQITQATEGGCKAKGYATDFSWGYRMLFSFLLPLPAVGIDLTPLVAWSSDIEGYSIDGSQVEGRHVLNLKMRAVYQRAFFLEIGRTWVNSNTDYDVARDKDLYSIAVGMAF